VIRRRKLSARHFTNYYIKIKVENVLFFNQVNVLLLFFCYENTHPVAAAAER